MPPLYDKAHETAAPAYEPLPLRDPADSADNRVYSDSETSGRRHRKGRIHSLPPARMTPRRADLRLDRSPQIDHGHTPY